MRKQAPVCVCVACPRRRWPPASTIVRWQIARPKPRQICAADFRDRVVHHAVCRVLEARLEAFLIFDTYACRKGKGTKKALERAQAFSRKGGHALHLDIEKYFASIKGEVLFGQLERLVGDKRVLELLRMLLEHRPEGMADGLPIGNLTSQWFANVYLGGLDHRIKRVLGVRRSLRYMDDFLLFGEDKAEMWEWKKEIEAHLWECLGLRLKESENRLVPVSEGSSFLGFRVFPKLIRLGQATKRRFLRGWRTTDAAVFCGETSEEAAQRRMRGLLGHALLADTCMLRRQLLEKKTRRGRYTNRVKRGGSWNNNANNLRAANRNNNTPTNRNNNIGFRVVNPRQIPEKR